MNVRICVLVALVCSFVLPACGEEKGDAQAKLKAAVKKYMDMPGDPTPGVAVEMAEFVDRERTLVQMAETEIIDGLKKAGVAVLAKGKPEYVVYGAVESNWGGQQVAFGTDVSAYEAAITVKVIDTRSGTIVDAASAQVRKVNPSREAAAREAIKEAGTSAAKKIVDILKQNKKDGR